MKRKLDENDTPRPADPSCLAGPTFEALGLDSRLLQNIAQEGFSLPTPVQLKAIPLALEGRDIIARAKTGSGKTAAYVLPILESILRQRKNGAASKSTIALILVPTRELAHQVAKVVAALTRGCSKEIRHVNLMQKVSQDTQRSLLSNKPEIVICTPARAVENISSQSLLIKSLAHIIIDEADLVLSYGHDDDLKRISELLPIGAQKILTSATISTDVDTVRNIFCQNPVILELDEGKDETKDLSQYYVKCAEDDKFLFAFVIFKLRLVKGKCIIFVGDTDRSYRLKLFFEQFGIRSCILNAELPVNSRVHVVEEFNKNVYDIIIAADGHEMLGENRGSGMTSHEGRRRTGTATTNAEPIPDSIPDQHAATPATEYEQAPKEIGKLQMENRKKNKDYGISRGLDFRNVACILNFDMPVTSESYVHRVGRTARAGQTGMALSFIVPTNEYHKSKSTSFPGTKNDEAVLAKVLEYQESIGQDVKPYHFNMKQVDAFRYRMNDALRTVTALAIRQARTQEIRRELLKSEKLKRHFEENPNDLNRLRHDGEIRAVRIQQHLKHVPDYLLPESGPNGIITGDSDPLVLKTLNVSEYRKGKRPRTTCDTKNQRHRDPLRSFSTTGKPRK